MLLAHGLPKVGAYPNPNFPDPLGVGADVSLALAIFAEAIAPVFVLLGLWTRLALIPLIVTMLVAVFLVHGQDPFAKMELGFMYLVGYIALFFTGSGKFSIDYRLGQRSA